jgi:hypothetical protein
MSILTITIRIYMLIPTLTGIIAGIIGDNDEEVI